MAEEIDPAEVLSAAWDDLDAAEQSTDIDVVRDRTTSAIRKIIRAMAKNHGLVLPDHPKAASASGGGFDSGNS